MKFCFFGNIHGAFRDKTPGGAELQISLLARALALKGQEVVIVDPYSPESFTTEEGIRIINVPGWNSGLRGLRLFTNRIPALRKIFREQKADYYYARMRTYFHLFSYRAAKKNGAKFIVAIAAEVDLMNFGSKFKHKYSKHFNPFGYLTLAMPNDLVFNYLLKRADYVFLQHEDQKIRYKSIKGKAIIFRNIFLFSKVESVPNPTRDYYIQVGTINVVKGSPNLFKLVHSVNHESRIVIVGQPVDNKSKKLYEELRHSKNVRLEGRLKHSETMRMIANAKALISTSNFEGFPNIFLEAWASGVPVISYRVNPGNVINKFHLGLCCDGDLEKMKNYMETDAVSSVDPKNLKKYVSEFHDFERAGDRFLKIINNE